MAHHKSLGEEGRKDGEGTGATRSPVPGGVSPTKRAAPVPTGIRGQSRTPCPLLRPTAGCCTHGVFSQRGFVPVGFFPSGVFSLCDFLPPASAPGLLLPRGHPEEQLGIRKTPSKGSGMGLHGLRAEEYLGAEVQSRQGGSSGSNEEAANTRGARGEAQQAQCDAAGFLRGREEPRVSGLEAKLLPPLPPLHPLPLRLQISACSCWT